MRAAYTGHEALTFNDYLDLETGRTLHAEPGQSYDIIPASGRMVPEVPEPWFAPFGEGGEQPEPEPQAEPEPGTEEGQSF